MAGFVRIIKEETYPKIKDHMLDYLVALFDDAYDFSWDAAKASRVIFTDTRKHSVITIKKLSFTKKKNTQGNTVY